MFGAISGKILLDIFRGEGGMFQMELFETVPEYRIEEKYLTTVFNGYNCILTEHGSSGSRISSIDHPAFTTLRELLGDKGYIEIQRSWCNGDRVTKEFKVNGKVFEIGDKFSSASAMHYTLTKGNPVWVERNFIPIEKNPCLGIKFDSNRMIIEESDP